VTRKQFIPIFGPPPP